MVHSGMLLSRSRNSAIIILVAAFLLAVPSSPFCATVTTSPRRVGECWKTTKTPRITTTPMTTPQLSPFADSILVSRALSSTSSSSTQQQRLNRVLSVLQISAHENDHDNSSSSVFTQVEIQEMEKVIVSLSQISNDAVRREKVASLFDVELTNAAATATTTTSGDEDDVSCPPGGVGIDDGEMPRFAKLFQVALNTIGEQVQASAREVASMTHNENGDEDDVVSMEEQQYDDGRDVDDAENTRRTTKTREKSPEELQLWALIDMMVQSKTRVKMHMGKLGSKGEFR